ncbi:MAG: hypothetical protein MZW92_46205 [Comamonadaceae bacterium]|nr:hypothetical protein [Comamonadaceae bacterium]
MQQKIVNLKTPRRGLRGLQQHPREQEDQLQERPVRRVREGHRAERRRRDRQAPAAGLRVTSSLAPGRTPNHRPVSSPLSPHATRAFFAGASRYPAATHGYPPPTSQAADRRRPASLARRRPPPGGSSALVGAAFVLAYLTGHLLQQRACSRWSTPGWSRGIGRTAMRTGALALIPLLWWLLLLGGPGLACARRGHPVDVLQVAVYLVGALALIRAWACSCCATASAPAASSRPGNGP